MKTWMGIAVAGVVVSFAALSAAGGSANIDEASADAGASFAFALGAKDGGVTTTSAAVDFGSKDGGVALGKDAGMMLMAKDAGFGVAMAKDGGSMFAKDSGGIEMGKDGGSAL